MGLVREPLGMDFEFDPRPLTEDEKEKISAYIKSYKGKNSNRNIRSSSTMKRMKPKKIVVA
jgi:hypothetical protein